jgi:uncharacterized membrane protein
MNQAVNRWSVRTLAAGLLGVAGLAQIPAAAAASYQLQTLSGVGYGADMNNAGLVVGGAGSLYGGRPVSWLAGTTTFLPQTSQTLVASATGVSQNGFVVGGLAPLFGGESAVRWQGDTYTLLNPKAPAVGAYATAVNNSGVAVGWAEADPLYGFAAAAIWSADGSPGLLNDLTRNGASAAYDINNDGLVVGSSLVSLPGADFGIGWRAVQWSQGVPTALQSPGAGTYDVARGISESGLIVGASRNAARYDTAALWIGASDLAFNLGTLPGDDSSWANAVNRSGQAVGSSYQYFNQDNTPNRAVLWDGFVATDLNLFLSPEQVQAGWKLYDATSINDAGAILVNGLNIVSNEYQAFLLTPVPEPGTWALFLSGLAGVALAKKRRMGTHTAP